MSRTQKDSRRQQGTVIEVIKVGADAFDLLINHDVFRRNAPHAALPDWLCVSFGFCGEEYEAILQEIEREGRKVIVL
jgi:hypothetical protein